MLHVCLENTAGVAREPKTIATAATLFRKRQVVRLIWLLSLRLLGGAPILHFSTSSDLPAPRTLHAATQQ